MPENEEAVGRAGDGVVVPAVRVGGAGGGDGGGGRGGLDLERSSTWSTRWCRCPSPHRARDRHATRSCRYVGFVSADDVRGVSTRRSQLAAQDPGDCEPPDRTCAASLTHADHYRALTVSPHATDAPIAITPPPPAPPPTRPVSSRLEPPESPQQREARECEDSHRHGAEQQQYAVATAVGAGVEGGSRQQEQIPRQRERERNGRGLRRIAGRRRRVVSGGRAGRCTSRRCRPPRPTRRRAGRGRRRRELDQPWPGRRRGVGRCRR